MIQLSEKYLARFRKRKAQKITPESEIFKNVKCGSLVFIGIGCGHPGRKACEFEIFAAFRKEEMNKQVAQLNGLIEKCRIPISPQNIQKIPFKKGIRNFENLIAEHSENADLVVTGFSLSRLAEQQGEFLRVFQQLKTSCLCGRGNEL